MGKQQLNQWPRTTGRQLEMMSTVICSSLALPQIPGSSVGYIISSHQVGRVWEYCVAIPPFPRLRVKWHLVAGVHPSQLTPISMLVPEPHDRVSSSARIVDSNYNSKLPFVQAPKSEIYSGSSSNGAFYMPGSGDANQTRELLQVATDVHLSKPVVAGIAVAQSSILYSDKEAFNGSIYSQTQHVTDIQVRNAGAAVNTEAQAGSRSSDMAAVTGKNSPNYNACNTFLTCVWAFLF